MREERYKNRLSIPKYTGKEDTEDRIEADETVPGYICLGCKQTWRKDEDKLLREHNDPHCPYCGSKGVRKWRIHVRE